jgi:hypothetical protein
MDPALSKRGGVEVQAVKREARRQFGQDRAGAATHFEDAVRFVKVDLVEDIRPQVAGPSGLLGVA